MENYPANSETNLAGAGQMEQGAVEPVQGEQVQAAQVEQPVAPAEMPRAEAGEVGVNVIAAAEQVVGEGAVQPAGAEQPAVTGVETTTVEAVAEGVSDKEVLGHLCDELAADFSKQDVRKDPNKMAETREMYDFFSNVAGIRNKLEQDGREAVSAETIIAILETNDRQKAELSQDAGEKERLMQQADKAQKFAAMYGDEKKKYAKNKAEDAQITQQVTERQAEAAATPPNPNALSTAEIV